MTGSVNDGGGGTGSGASFAPTAERLLESALRVFGQLGYDDARISDVCADAGAARATFYRHFTGKEEVFLALADRLRTQVGMVVAEVDPVTPDVHGAATLRHLITGLLETSAHWAPVIRVLGLAGTAPEQARREARDSVVTVTRRLGAALRAGGAELRDPTTTALAILGLADGVGLQIGEGRSDAEREALAGSLSLLVLAMLFPTLDVASLGPATTSVSR